MSTKNPLYTLIVEELAPTSLKWLAKKGVHELADREDIVAEAMCNVLKCLNGGRQINTPKKYFRRVVNNCFTAWLRTQPMGESQCADEPTVEAKKPSAKKEKEKARQQAKRRVAPVSFNELNKSRNDDGADGIAFLDTVEGLYSVDDCKERLNDIIRLCANDQDIELRPPSNKVRKQLLEFFCTDPRWLDTLELSKELGVGEDYIKTIKSQYKRCLKALPSFLEGDFTNLPRPMNKSDALFVCYYMLDRYIHYEGRPKGEGFSGSDQEESGGTSPCGFPSAQNVVS